MLTSYTITGPISSMLTNKFGCRPVIMLGGLMSGVGLTVCYFTPNLYYLFFTFGLLAGKWVNLKIVYSPNALGRQFLPLICRCLTLHKTNINICLKKLLP